MNSSPSEPEPIEFPVPAPRVRYNKSGWMRWLLIPLGLLLACIPFVRPIYRFYKDRNATRLALHAQESMRAGDYQSAAPNIAEAYRLSPDNADSLRAMAIFSSKVPSLREKAKYCYERLESLGKITPEDHLEEASIYVVQGNLSRTEKILSSLPEPLRDSPRGLRIQFQICLGRGEQIEAENLQRRYLLSLGSENDKKLNTILEGLKITLPEFQNTLISDLWQFSTQQDANGLIALERIAQSPNLTKQELLRLVDLLKAHPLAQNRHQYIALNLQIRINPEQREQIIKDQIKSCGHLPLAELEMLFVWLIEQGKSKTILDILPEESAKLTEAIFAQYLTALATEGKWDIIKNILTKGQSLPLHRGRIFLLMAQSRYSLHEGITIVKEEIRKALEAGIAENDFTLVRKACVFAEKIGLPDLALSGFALLEGQPHLSNMAIEQTLRIAASQRDVSLMKSTLERIIRNNPEREVAAQRLVYLQLVSGENLELARIEADAWADKTPNSPISNLNHALAAFRFRDETTLKPLLNSIPSDKLPPGQRAVLAVLLDHIGRTHEAVAIAEKIPRPLLLPDEEDLFKTSF